MLISPFGNVEERTTKEEEERRKILPTRLARAGGKREHKLRKEGPRSNHVRPDKRQISRSSLSKPHPQKKAPYSRRRALYQKSNTEDQKRGQSPPEATPAVLRIGEDSGIRQVRVHMINLQGNKLSRKLRSKIGSTSPQGGGRKKNFTAMKRGLKRRTTVKFGPTNLCLYSWGREGAKPCHGSSQKRRGNNRGTDSRETGN